MSDKSEEFWDRTGAMLVWHLAGLDVEFEYVERIVVDILQRCADIPTPALSAAEQADFERDLAAVLIDLASAEQLLIKARTGRMPGRLIDDWPPTPIAFYHPFLAAIQQVTNQVEAEANQAKYSRRPN